jgi:hypothetical protein
MLSNFLAYKNRMSLLWSIGRLYVLQKFCELLHLPGKRSALGKCRQTFRLVALASLGWLSLRPLIQVILAPWHIFSERAL